MHVQSMRNPGGAYLHSCSVAGGGGGGGALSMSRGSTKNRGCMYAGAAGAHLKRGADEEVLLLEAQLFALVRAVIRIEYTRDRLSSLLC